jgi:putative membrane protein
MTRRILLGLSTFFLIIFVYEGAVRLSLQPWITLPSLFGGVHSQTLILLLFSLTHAFYALGWRNTLVFFAVSAVISWAYEQVGVATGAIFGPYHYTDVLGVKLGHVPLLIPLAWFMMIYPSYVMANLIADDQPIGSRGSLKRIVWLSFLSAAVMTAWDLVVDPLLSGPNIQAWIWEQGGPYFGIPIQNYIGWMLTTFTVYLIYRLYERRSNPKPIGPVTTPVAAMPLIAYGAIMISNMLAGPEALRVIGPFVMGVPLIAAATRLRVYRHTQEAQDAPIQSVRDMASAV